MPAYLSRIFFNCFSLSLSLFITILSAQNVSLQILPVSDIESGMTGVGKTVFRGDSIEEFDVKIIGTLKNFLPKKDIILAELQGDRLKYTGVIGGMSGSPIYIDGKLIGALAYGWQFSKDPIFGITPIEQMLEIDTGDKSSGAAAPQSGATAVPHSGSAYLYDPFRGPSNPLLEKIPVAQGTTVGSETAGGAPSLTRLEIPLTFSGCHPSIVDHYGKLFSAFGLVPLVGGNSGESSEKGVDNIQFEAGSAVSAQLIRGDISLAATGTLTLRDGNRILAFGHSFLNFGPVDFPMTAAEIVTVLPNLARSFKISNSTVSMGSIKTDHTNGISGQIGDNPKMIPFDLELNLPGEKSEHFHYEMVRHKMLTPVLGAISLVNSLLPVKDALSEQTLTVKGQININGTESIRIDNMYAGTAATGQFSQDVQTILQYLYSNYYGPAEISDIRLQVKAEEGFPRVQVNEIHLDRETLYPGDSVRVDIVLNPYGGPEFREQFTIAMPETDSDKKLIIMAGAADMITRTEFQLSPSRFLYTSLDHLVSLINSARKNNYLYIKIFQLDRGLMLDGHEMTNLPPSILSLLQSGKSSGATLPLNDYTFKEINKPMDYVVSGLKIVQVDLKPEP